MKHTNKRLIFVGGAVAAALTGSALVALPAYAADPLHGTVNDGATPVANAKVYLLRYDASDRQWEQDQDLATTAANGTWTTTVQGTDLSTGKYALWYDLSDSAQALYSLSQSSNGLSAKDGETDPNNTSVGSLALPTDLTVTSGVASKTSFATSLLHNAGAVTVSLVDTTGAAITNPGAGYGEIDLNDGFNQSTGYVYGPDVTVSGSSFAGTIIVGHVPAGAYTDGQAYADGYNSEYLNPVAVTVGGTTQYGAATLQTSGTASADTVESVPNAVTVTGVAKVDALLTAVVPTSTNGVPLTVTYQWFQGFAFGSDGTPIAGANAATFVPTAAQLGDQLYVEATIRQTGLTSDRLSSRNLLTDPVVVGDPNQASVTVGGTAKFGSTLKATVAGGTVAGAKTAAYQWYRNGAPISSADGSTYTLTKADVGQKVFASVTSFSQGHTDAVIPSNTVGIAHDKVKVAFSAKTSIFKSAKLKVKVNLKDGTSKNAASGTVRVYYSSTKYKKLTFTSKSTTKTATLPKLAKGKHTIKIKYYGDTHYLTKSTSFKVTVK